MYPAYLPLNYTNLSTAEVPLKWASFNEGKEKLRQFYLTYVSRGKMGIVNIISRRAKVLF